LSICASSHEEAIDLRLGQGVGPLQIDRVLGREDEERIGQLEAIALDGHLSLLHGLEQGALRLGGGAVDLVRQNDVGEDRAGAQGERPVPRRQDVRARDVGREQIGRELDAAGAAAERRRERLHERGLGDAGHSLEQRMTASQQRHEDRVDRAR
jgi:hypothetical protein